METGEVRVEKVGGKSTVTRCFSRYPLKFIIPTKVSFALFCVYVMESSFGSKISD